MAPAAGVMASIRSLFGRGYKYTALPDPHQEEEQQQQQQQQQQQSPSRREGRRERRRGLAVSHLLAVVCVIFIGLLMVALVRTTGSSSPAACDTPQRGFQCNTDFSHSWGQYSPYFAVPSEIDAAVPAGCALTFAQVLARHGARDPTASKTRAYDALVARIHDSVTTYGPGYEFIRDYDYALGADQLTALGHQQMTNAGIQFYERYRTLAGNQSTPPPFVRSSGQNRVVESARNWTQGFYQALIEDGSDEGSDGNSDPYSPYPILVIPEAKGENNTLSHGLCRAFESGGAYAAVGGSAQAVWADIFAPGIADRLNANLPGANFSAAEVPGFMELCPFNTVAGAEGWHALSPFCGLFSADEWAAYDYHASLGKWYGYGAGNPLGATQGVGYVNELVARLTGRPVVDHTSSNASLDADPHTFPLDLPLYADFSHDNDITGIMAALGLYADPAVTTNLLPNDTRVSPEQVGGYAASWTVPFAARVYVEKMFCGGQEEEEQGRDEDQDEEELVRVLVNDRVVPLRNCGADALGRCTLSRFVDSLGFARSGGFWDLCFADADSR